MAARRSAAPRALTESPFAAPSLPVRNALLLGLLCWAVYLSNVRVMSTGDSVPTRLLPFSILREGNLDLDEFPVIRPSGYLNYYVHRDAAGRWRSAYPPATAVLATPFAAPVVWWLNSRGTADDEVRFRVAVAVAERLAASALTAASVGFLFLAACRVARRRVALVTALVYAFGTNTFALSSQALWQHGPAELCLAALSLCLLLPPARGPMVAAGITAALAVAVRPMMAPFAVAALFFVIRNRRPWIVPFVAAPALIGAAFVGYNYSVFSQFYGPYGSQLSGPGVEPLLGVLVSPNRGLLIFTPAVLLAFAGAWRRRSEDWIGHLPWVLGVHLLMLSSYPGWFSGTCWGPRYFTDVLPAIVLLAAAGSDRILRSRPAKVFAAVTIAWSVLVQFVGVFMDSGGWDRLPIPVEEKTERVWDWSDLQIVRALNDGWHGCDMMPLLVQAMGDEPSARVRPLAGAELSGTLTMRSAPSEHWIVGTTRMLDIEVRNESNANWPAFTNVGPLSVGVLARWICRDAMVGDVGSFTHLRRNLAPGNSDTLTFSVPAPASPGRCFLNLAISQIRDPLRGSVGPNHLEIPFTIE